MHEQAHERVCAVWGILADNPLNGQPVVWDTSQPDSRLISIIAYIMFNE